MTHRSRTHERAERSRLITAIDDEDRIAIAAILRRRTDRWLEAMIELATEATIVATDELKRRRLASDEAEQGAQHPVLRAAADVYGIPIADFARPHDDRPVSEARKAAAWWLRQYEQLQVATIADIIGRSAGSTSYLIRQHHRRMGDSPLARRRMHEIARTMAGEIPGF